MTLDLVIPTMWQVASFPDVLAEYAESSTVGNIFVIDNNRRARPSADILNHQKITIIDYGRNIYVNPAWNEGYLRSDADILGLINDDIRVGVSLFDYVLKLDFAQLDLIGVHLKFGDDNFQIGKHHDPDTEIFPLPSNPDHPVGGLAWAFGVCMFVKRSSYKLIPSLYQIWFGDDYLVQNLDNIAVLKTNQITGRISETLVSKQRDPDIQNRIVLDAENVARFSHFKNGKNWKLIRDIIQNKEILK